jgi:TolB-like protein/Tfp pilus assembly protein PilF
MPAEAQLGKPRIDLSRYELTVDGRRVRLERQAMDILILLARNRTRLVSREEIASALWGDNVFVDTERSINSIIHKLRVALRDDAKEPRVIETVIGKGYRLIAGVNIMEAPNAAIQSIAVLALRNLSGDSSQDYFAAGLTDELTTSMARITSLRVVSATSTVQYSTSLKPLRQIARELNVEAVVEGSVTRSGSRVRITVQLIDAHKDSHLWAQSYERDLGEILDIQNSVALDIAEQVRANLTSAERETLAVPKTVSPLAYEAYLRGRVELGKQTPETLRRGLEEFQRAIALDPQYPRAYAALADSYSLLADYTALLPNTAFPRAKTAALKALEQDHSLGEAHAALAYVKHHYEWDWAGAEIEYKVAIQLDPSRTTSHLRYAEFLSNVGRHDEAIAEVTLAHRLAPLSRLVESKLGWFLYQARRYREAIPRLQAIVAAEPTQYYARIFLGLCYEQEGMYLEAITEFEITATEFNGRESFAQAHCYACTGRIEDARRILAALEQPGPDGAQSWFWIASVYAALGETDQAFVWLNLAFKNHDYFLTFLKTEPRMDPVRSDRRFARAMENLVFP